jgi:molybdate transport system substrate-binding protein
MKRTLAAGFLAMAGLFAARAEAAEIKVLAAEVVEAAVKELAPAFEARSGHKLAIEYGFAVEQVKRVQAGEPVDAVVFPVGLIRAPASAAALVADSATPLIRIGQGVAVRRGAPKPDIGTPEALKQALLAAKSVAFVPAGTSGQQTQKMFETLGIAEDMKAKTKPQPVAEVAASVARGEAELALFLTNYLVAAEGVDYVGPYPGALQQYVSFSGAVGAKAQDAEAARAFIRFLADPAAAAVIKAKGMEPG